MSDLLPESLSQTFKGILFDLDGTLIDSEGFHYTSFVTAMREFGYDFDEASEGVGYEGSFRKMFETIANKLHFDEEMFEKIYNRKMELTMLNTLEQTDKIDGVISFLELMVERNVPMGVVTNSDRAYAENAVDKHQISNYFQLLISRTDLDEGKPSPEGYTRGAEMLEMEAKDVLVFENTDTGITAGKAANMKVVAIRNTDIIGDNTYADADHAVDSFADPSLDAIQFNTL